MSLTNYYGNLPLVARYGSGYALSRGSRFARAALRYGGASVARYAFHNPDKIAGLIGRGANAAAGRIGRWFRRKRQENINAKRGFVTQKGILGKMSIKKGPPLRLKGGAGTPPGFTQASGSQFMDEAAAAGWKSIKGGRGKFNTKVNVQQLLENMCPVWTYSYESTGVIQVNAANQSYTEIYALPRTEVVERMQKLVSTDIEAVSTHALTAAADPTTNIKMNFQVPLKCCGISKKFKFLNECNNTASVKVIHFVCIRNTPNSVNTCWNYDLENSETYANAVAPIGAADPDPTYIGQEPGMGIPIAMRRTWKRLESRKFIMQPGQEVDCRFFIKPQVRYMGDWIGDDVDTDGTTSNTTNTYIKGVSHCFMILAHGQLNSKDTAPGTLVEGPLAIGYKLVSKEQWRSCPLNRARVSTTTKIGNQGVANGNFEHYNEFTQVSSAYTEDT